ncbi:LytR/AlgR family response regulator transcription factor [Clostridium chromiireducens]|uniref:Stage 0 sporulation protein A homolog n=2 Tax=Clostridium chromiireducens TaxID=225345 RepID=A0A1V4IIG5_9CLOT|nr:LytTR family DNA-binding domain-containing protein [Clostridium chromiireducens]OPJ59798.1 transcriptional regulatory protein YpdB [Clostridium chromiireducens]
MINIAICDDIIEELETISSYVSNNIKELDIPFKISSFSEGQDLLEHINSSKQNFDIIFLDVYMKFSNGIDIARRIRDFDKECKIIFITSSKEHAVDSYDVSALHYILKPINEEKLTNAIKIAIESLTKENKHFVIMNKKGNYRISYKDILYAESKARIVNIYLKSSEVISFYSKLEDFFQSLKDERFLRCHKSFVVNMDYILKIENNCAFMCNNIIIPITSSNMTLIKEKYFNYLLKEV